MSIELQSPPQTLAACLDRKVPTETLARRAAQVTLDEFAVEGTNRRRMLLYAPLYVSSHCTNHCAYCGFRGPRRIERRHLNCSEAMHQAEILGERGFRHLLVVAGDFPRLTTTEYFAEILDALGQRGIAPAVEIAPQSTESYATLAAAGACGVTLYQETYNEELYAMYHAGGSKASFDWRRRGLDRAAEAGIRRLGMGILLGLADPTDDVVAMARHACSLQSRFPEHTLAFSLPRIHRAPAGFQTPYPVDDETFVRLYCALRIAFPRAELVLSTRERATLRNRLARICITQMSAGSSATPGGYEDGEESPGGQQFPVDDDRTPAEIADWLRTEGFDVAWDVPVG